MLSPRPRRSSAPDTAASASATSSSVSQCTRSMNDVKSCSMFVVTVLVAVDAAVEVPVVVKDVRGSRHAQMLRVNHLSLRHAVMVLTMASKS